MKLDPARTTPAGPVPESPDFRLNRITLGFKGAARDLEAPFLNRYFSKNLNHLRNCHLYTVFFYAMAGFIDYVVFPRNMFALFSVRFLIVIPIFLIGYEFSFSSYYSRCWQQISFFYILLTGGSFITFTLMADPPRAYDYYVGVLFCLIFGYTFIRERFIYASIAGGMLISGYLLVSVTLLKMPASILFQSNFYLFTINLLGMLIARHLEMSARRDFYLEYKLSEERKKVMALNNALEQRVSERTRDLKVSNEMLRNKIDALHESESERRRLESQLRQAQKMKAIGTLAGGIAHDFNNILSSVIGYTELAIDDIGKESTVAKYLQEVYTAGNRAKDLVHQILAFARQSEESVKPIQVSAIAREILKLLRSSIPSNIDIRADLQSDAYVMGDPINVHQMLMNLATNASHAMEDGGTIVIGTKDVCLGTDAAAPPEGLTPGDYLKISVSDTGTGISPEIIDSIFEPYFTTKQVGEGTGMGLAMVYGLVKKYKGEITVESAPGKGSVFSIFLPATRRRETKEPYQSGPLPTGNERILLIDDEPPVARMSGRILEALGYGMTIHSSSAEALTLFRSRPNDFDLVVTDMTMPEITGDKLALEVMAIRPDIPVIICTGYSRKMSADRAAQIGVKAIIHKPITKADIAGTVRQVLDGCKTACGKNDSGTHPKRPVTRHAQP